MSPEVCGAALPSEPISRNDCPRTRRKSAPERRANANAQGPRRPKGHDRLMSILYLLTPNPRGGGG